MFKWIVFLFLVIFSNNLSAGTRFGVWSEFLNPNEVADKLDLIKRHFQVVHLAVRSNDLTNPEFWETFRLLQQHGLEVRPWPLLNEEQGVWPNKWNAEIFTALVYSILGAAEKHHIRFAWLTVDMEPPFELQEKLSLHMKKFKIFKAIKLLKKSAKSVSLDKARSQYLHLIDELHQRSIKVHVVTTPLALYDFGPHRKPKVQNALGIPIQGLPWDQVTFMVYRPFFMDMMGALNARLVFDFCKKIKKFFPEHGGVDLGPIGKPGQISSPNAYEHALYMRQDIAAAKLAGLHNINIFSLDGLHPIPHWDDWLYHEKLPKPRRQIKLAAFHSFIKMLRSLVPGA